jgi:hypothetical protein
VPCIYFIDSNCRRLDWDKRIQENSVSHLIFSFLPMLTTIQIIENKKNSAFLRISSFF